MATITPQSAAANAAVTYAAATTGGGDSIAMGTNTRVAFLVRNASGSSITVTFTGAVTCSQGSTHNVPVTCAVGDTAILVPAQAISPTTGNATVTYSAVTSITVAAVYDH